MQIRAEARKIDGQTPLSPGPASPPLLRHDVEIIRFRLPRASPRSSSDTPIPSAVATRHFFSADFSRFPNTRLASAGSDSSEVHNMLTLEEKVKQLEVATAVSQSALVEKESALSSASQALERAKSKLRSLSPEAQQTLQVNETELPELISAKLLAQGEYDEAKKRVEANQKYLLIFRDKVPREE